MYLDIRCEWSASTYEEFYYTVEKIELTRTQPHRNSDKLPTVRRAGRANRS